VLFKTRRKGGREEIDRLHGGLYLSDSARKRALQGSWRVQRQVLNSGGDNPQLLSSWVSGKQREAELQ